MPFKPIKNGPVALRRKPGKFSPGLLACAARIGVRSAWGKSLTRPTARTSIVYRLTTNCPPHRPAATLTGSSARYHRSQWALPTDNDVCLSHKSRPLSQADVCQPAQVAAETILACRCVRIFHPGSPRPDSTQSDCRTRCPWVERYDAARWRISGLFQSYSARMPMAGTVARANRW